jgi:hypothetical protein
MSSHDSKPRKMLKWLCYSGASVSVTVNPCHWRIVPRAGRDHSDVWRGPKEHMFVLSWLMISLRIWVDDGSW